MLPQLTHLVRRLHSLPRAAMASWLVVGAVIAPFLTLGCSEDDGGNDAGASTGSTATGSGSTSSDGGNNGSGGGTATGGSGTGGSVSGSGGSSACALDACAVCDGDGSTCGCTEGDCVEWVAAHNAIRQAVNDGTFEGQPKAEPPIPMVTWDPLIAAKAQEYADSLSDFGEGHSSDDFRTYASTGYSGYHGENMAIGGGQYADIDYIVGTSWGADEAQNCQLKSCGGHYTQIVWRESIAIGCGRKEGVTFTADGKQYTGTLSVCQYGPGGNINNRDPY